MKEIILKYKELITLYTEKRITKQKQVKQLAFGRLTVFLLGVIFLYITANISSFALIAEITIFISVFIFIIKKHQKAQKELDALKTKEDINIKELDAIKGNYSHFEDGEEFRDPDHAYSDDLDIFGRGSVFQYLNRTSSVYGKKTLATWLNKGLKDKDQIELRQNATSELAKKLEWRQDYMTWGKLLPDKGNELEEIQDWMEEENLFQSKLYSVLIILIPMLSFTLLTLNILSVIPFSLLLLYLIFIPLGITTAKLRKVNRQHMSLTRKTNALKKYGILLELVENEAFNSKRLQTIQKDLTLNQRSASIAIKKLSKHIDWLDHRLNIIMGFLLNAFLLWDARIMRDIERWKLNHKNEIENWFDLLGETDALCSLANYSYNNPDFIQPIVVDQDFQVKSTDAGHPLIDSADRINNPIDVEHWKYFTIITGANMAGKSTYLRTVGVNLVLAMAGAPVCAKDFSFTPVDLFTSIRTKDNLQKHESYFYAELKRLQEIIERIRNGQQLFIILDEILKGTNSKDKQSGSIALLKQLISLSSAGLIATHDLALGELINVYPKHVRNRCFEVEIQDDKLDFDYKLKEGVAQNLNATFLMQKMGIVME